jgi:hypothetical protein
MINDRGYTFVDIRTGKEYRSGNGLHWRVLPQRAVASVVACCPVHALSLGAAHPQDPHAAGGGG